MRLKLVGLMSLQTALHHLQENNAKYSREARGHLPLPHFTPTQTSFFPAPPLQAFFSSKNIPYDLF